MGVDPARYGAVVIGASLGGGEALQVLLGGVRTELPVPVVVAQHLAPAPSRLDAILSRVSRHPVGWAHDGEVAAPGRVYLCPGRTLVRLEPDGTMTVRASMRGSSYGLVDELFGSAADALGPHVLALVLTGLGHDGAAGARAVKRAGGTVIVQDEATATAFGMPAAVAAAGDADLVLPLGELPGLLDRVIGAGRPVPTPAVRAAEAVFAAGGEAGALMAATDWGSTGLGPVERWPPALRHTLAAALAHPVPMCVMWGPDLLQLYNDAYRRLIGERHPAALGRPAAQSWPGAVDVLGSALRRVSEAGEAVRYDDHPLVMDRAGFAEEVFATIACGPVRDAGAVAGVLVTLVETTERVRAARRLATLHRLATVPAAEDGPATDRATCRRLVDVLAANPNDVPFAILYLVDGPTGTAHLAAGTGLAAGSPALDPLVTPERPAAWPLQATVREAVTQIVDDLPGRFPGLAAGPWPQPPHTALILPAGPTRDGTPAAVLVAGADSHAPLDAAYRRFFDLLAEHAGATLAAARALLDGRQRLAAQAALSRTSTEFLADVGHALRTPLTPLLLALERQLAEVPPERLENPRIAHRNALRLLRLVDGLLALYEPAPAIERVDDLAARTAELAAGFRPAVERAGLRYVVDCHPPGRAVHLDAHMWETVLLNLLSNALRHTFTGGITVRLRGRPRHVELTVADTGVGIDPAEIPKLFTRFHRVHGARSRGHEGSGLGLALAGRLVRRYRGSIRVHSEPGRGATFTVWIPYTQPSRRTARVADPRERAETSARVRRAFTEGAECRPDGGEAASPT
ncbi:chemotaxis protein CheB [Dactylosporangium sp. NPDC000555]|uniref:chemotaxis protein CheB n=1 Tax=Dactylosporangium sp. NPDC000555 TaxID=3154260 RepID=UPI00331D9989